MERPQIKTAGLKWRARKDRWIPYWLPHENAVKAGYPSGAVNLESLFDGTETGTALLVSRCEALQAQMNLWLSGLRTATGAYDGTIGSVLRLYETHPESPYHSLKPGSRYPYAFYLGRLQRHIGSRLAARVTGLEVRSWHKVWSDADEHGRPRKIAAGAMAMCVLKTAVKFGAICGHDDCKRFHAELALVEIPKPRPRKMVATAADVVRAGEAARAHGAPSRALAYAIQFETVLRLWDVTGQWYPLKDPLVSGLVAGDRKWAGLKWRHIGTDGVLRYTPTKTEDTSEASAVIDLSLCPMVLEEIARVPAEARSGPVIVNERTGLPYGEDTFQRGWKRDFKAAGLPARLWARDLRASAVTEGRRAGASISDAAKVAGHVKEQTTADVYDRERLEAARRFQAARLTVRDK